MLEKLQNQRNNILAQLNGQNITINDTKQALQQSFSDNKLNSEKLASTFNIEQTKQQGLKDALAQCEADIEREQVLLDKQALNARTEARRTHIKQALIKLDVAGKIAQKLTLELKSIVEEHSKAGQGVGNEIPDSARKILGDVISDSGFMVNSLRSTQGIKALTLDGDYDRLASNLREI